MSRALSDCLPRTRLAPTVMQMQMKFNFAPRYPRLSRAEPLLRRTRDSLSHYFAIQVLSRVMHLPTNRDEFDLKIVGRVAGAARNNIFPIDRRH